MPHARPFALTAFWIVLAASTLRAHDDHHLIADGAPPAPTAGVARDMAAIATRLLESLAPEQRAVAAFEFKDDERFNWHFVPRARKGLRLGDMKPPQRELALGLLKAGLSEQGAAKVFTVMSIEQILADIEKNKGPRRDPELYFWTLFGTPGEKQPWGWRVEGHHVSVNFTVVRDLGIAAGPAFIGSNPAEVKDGPSKGLRILAQEEDLGRALVKSLSDLQRQDAILPIPAPREIITGNNRQAILKQFQGIPASSLTEPQKAALMQLVGLYANRLRKELADEDLRRIAHAGLGKIYFAWAGSLEPGQGHYYRIHGPTFLVEYDNTQNNANHIHTVWRDLEHDFGGDMLKRHYGSGEHKH